MAKDGSRIRKSNPTSKPPTAVATARVTNIVRPPELERLQVFIGRWITEGETVGSTEAPPMTIVASDVYQWLPGGHYE